MIFQTQIELTLEYWHLKRAEHFLLIGNWFMYKWHLKKAKGI